MPETNREGSMYGAEAMNKQQQQQRSQIEEEEDDEVACGESIDNSQMRFEGHALQDGGGEMNGVDGVYSHALYVPGSEIPLATGGGGTDQLTLTFQGEVYVFDSVSPVKVQAVLLLLGGYEAPASISAIGVAPQNHRGLGDFPGRSSQPQRAASLNRFREKRKERCFDKKIRYTVRKEVALRMQRRKGQFTSSKAISNEMGSSSDWNASQGSGQEEQETLCNHCGISSKSTPMMRRGPAGPRSLCNACGLKWANKGILRDVPKVVAVGIQDPTVKITEQIEGDAKGSDAVTSADVMNSSNGDNSAVAERYSFFSNLNENHWSNLAFHIKVQVDGHSHSRIGWPGN